MNWKIVYAVIICLGLIHSDLARYWVENIYVRFLFPINKLNVRGRAELIALCWAPPFFPGVGDGAESACSCQKYRPCERKLKYFLSNWNHKKL